MCYTLQMEKSYSPVCGNVLDKLLKMSYSLVGRNIPSQKCGKDTFTGVTKKHCELDT